VIRCQQSFALIAESGTGLKCGSTFSIASEIKKKGRVICVSAKSAEDDLSQRQRMKRWRIRKWGTSIDILINEQTGAQIKKGKVPTNNHRLSALGNFQLF
jgi:hypothetical protein